MTFFKSPIDMELQILSLSFQHSWQPNIILLKQGRKLRNYSKCNKKLYMSLDVIIKKKVQERNFFLTLPVLILFLFEYIVTTLVFILSCLKPTLMSEKMFDNGKPFMNDQNYFLFHVKSSFCSWDIYRFSWLFDYVEKQLDKKA